MITSTGNTQIHWNYFLALERDLEIVSRYIEFCDANFSIYSIELARLLLSAASEVDVLAKLLCEHVQPGANTGNITQYRDVITANITDLPNEVVYVRRFNLQFKPWDNWNPQTFKSPFWWSSYNHVKHERNLHFNQATLQHVLNAMGALLILNIHHYRYELAPAGCGPYPIKEALRRLDPDSSLLFLNSKYYPDTRIVYT